MNWVKQVPQKPKKETTLDTLLDAIEHLQQTVDDLRHDFEDDTRIEYR